MRKYWDKVVSYLTKIKLDKWLHFCFGLIIAAFFNITLGITLCFIPSLITALLKELFDLWTTKEFDWVDGLATTLGGILIWVFVLLSKI